MKAIRLITAADEYDDTPGLVIKGTESFEGLMADRTGLLTAHDLLEHPNGVKHMGKVWDELEALGGIWYIRGQHGDMMTDHRNYHSPAVNVASDVTRMFSEYSSDPDNGPGGLRIGSRPHDFDEDFMEIISVARKDIPNEFNDMGNGSPDEDANGWSPELHALFEEYLKLALHRMRSGFRKAERRFERDGASIWNGHNLFYAVKMAVKEAIPNIEFEGQEFLLLYGNGEATCRPIYESGEY
jgi:hypothetical protein